MEKSTIIELSRWTSSDSVSNAQWTNNLSIPQIINEGDIVTVRNSYIDTTLQTTSSIEILEDVELSLNFLYYINNTGVGIYYSILKAGIVTSADYINTFSEPGKQEPEYKLDGPDALPYCLIFDTPTIPALNGKPVVETVYINIPANIYSQNALAQLITSQLELVNIQPTNQLMSSVSHLFTNGVVAPESDSTGFYQFAKPIEKPDSSKVVTVLQKQLYHGVCAGNGTERLKQTLFIYDSQNNLMACKLVPMTDNPNYCGITGLPANTIITPMMTFPESNQVIPLVQFESQPYFLRDAGFIGTSEFSIVYDPNGNRFNIEYMHTPILQNNNEVCMTYTNQIAFPNTDPISALNKRVSYHTSMGGIMLLNAYTNKSYNPLQITFPSILTQMGFKIDDLIDIEDLYTVFNGNNNMLNPTYNKFKYTNFLKYTTRNYAPFSMLSSQGTMKIPSIVYNTEFTMNINPSIFFNTYDDSTGESLYNGSGYNVTNSNVTIKIIASSNSKSSNENTGHFLLSLSSYPSNYINSEKKWNIHSVIGTYYLSSGSFCESQYEPNIYVHIGESMAISKMDIAILNPYTKRPASNLGENSSIYLEITNNLQNQAQQQKK